MRSIVVIALKEKVLNHVYEMLDTPDPQELNMVLNHFLEKIEVNGKEIMIFYSVEPPAKDNP
jgi:hypothetical protein